MWWISQYEVDSPMVFLTCSCVESELRLLVVYFVDLLAAKHRKSSSLMRYACWSVNLIVDGVAL
jgi:hypothetical protein